MVLRNKDSMYVNGRSSEVLKIKVCLTLLFSLLLLSFLLFIYIGFANLSSHIIRPLETTRD